MKSAESEELIKNYKIFNDSYHIFRWFEFVGTINRRKQNKFIKSDV